MNQCTDLKTNMIRTYCHLPKFPQMEFRGWEGGDIMGFTGTKINDETLKS